ncbi:MAG: succinylglutamate desuccinylase [Bacteroidales bacterium]|nr:succinylglutamate desuccinylase [Bacteroidales bacterium]
MIRKHLSAIIITIITATLGVIASIDFARMHHPEELYPSSNLTGRVMLSDYFDGIKGTNGDTEVFLFDSGIEGGTALLCGGAHPNEAASFLSTVVILENLRVTCGRVIIIPRLNNSAFTCSDPMEGFPAFYELPTRNGTRKFRLGSRVTNPLHQWPDPLVFAQYPSNQQLSGFETRNINRAYPGKADGNLTQRVAYAIIQLIDKENVSIAFDIHESSPEVPIVNVIVYHEKYEEIAMGAVLGLEMAGLQFSPETSPKNFHGLSHREWGDYTNAIPFLMETSNPSMGRLRGETNVELVLKGYCDNYSKAKESGALRIAYREETGEPIEHRVGRHIMGIIELINSYNLYYPDKQIKIENLPDYDLIMEKGVGEFLNN